MRKMISMPTLVSLIVATLLGPQAARAQTTSPSSPSEHFHHMPEGGRRALHGMVLFGSGTYFLEHIPMLTPPHDFQIVTEVILKDASGKLLTQDFSQASYTLKPNTSFSLNDYVAGRLKTFQGSIHQGSFEQGGPIVSGLENVTVEIKDYKVIRQLPASSQVASFTLNSGTQVFESNAIQPGQNIQLIRNVTSGKILWCVSGPDFFEPCP